MTTLVVVHPLLDVLARHSEFFLAQDLDYVHVAWGCLGLLVLVPLPLVLLRLVAGRLGQRPARVFDSALIAAAATLFFFQAGHASFLKSLGPLAVGISASLVAAFIVWIWNRFRGPRIFTSFLAPCVLAVPALFLFNPHIRALAEKPARPAPIAGDEVADTPVVFVVFDALSASAIMDTERNVNRFRFPNLARLADDSLWFTHARAVAFWTNEAIPALLTGRYPAADKPPSLAHHPENLFTALAESHRIVASEAMFHLCPPEINEYLAPERGEEGRLSTLASDLKLVYLHRTLPPAWSRSLAPIDQGWGHFGDRRSGTRPLDRFPDFLSALEDRAEPTLFYLHVIFPHMPYLVLPSGNIFRRQTEPHPTLARAEDRQIPDQETQIFLYKRYLFQVGYVDHLIAGLVQRLHQTDLYDRALIVVTADHGGRTAPFHAKGDIQAVPLLIKVPGQTRTGQQTQRVSILDVMPTLLDLLGTSSPWSTDGRSILADDYSPPDRIFVSGSLVEVEDGFDDNSQAAIEWKVENFGLGEDPLSLYRAGSPRPGLLGRAINQLTVSPSPDFNAKLDDGGPVIEVDPVSGFVPVLLRGSLYAGTGAAAGHDRLPQVAVSVNGVVEAVATTRLHQAPDWYRFRATVPESAYLTGANIVEVWLLDPEAPETLYGPLRSRSGSAR